MELNLKKPLVSQFLMDGRVQRVEYEDLPMICFQCGRYSHVSEFSKEEKQNQAICRARDYLDMGNWSISSNSDERMDMEGRRNLGNGRLILGSWIDVPKRGRRKVSKESASDKQPQNGISTRKSGGSGFESLANLNDQEETIPDENQGISAAILDDSGKVGISRGINKGSISAFKRNING